MKSTFLFKPESLEKMVKTSKFISQKQNKTKKYIYILAASAASMYIYMWSQLIESKLVVTILGFISNTIFL